MTLIEIDGLPFWKMGGSFHGYVSHNQMVTDNFIRSITYDQPKKKESASNQHLLTFPPAQNSCSPDTSSVASTSRSHHRAAPFETARPAHGAPSALGWPRPVLLLPTTAAPKDMSRVHPTCDGTYSLPPKTHNMFKRMTQKLNKTSTKPWFYRGYFIRGEGIAHVYNPTYFAREIQESTIQEIQKRTNLPN